MSTIHSLILVRIMGSLDCGCSTIVSPIQIFLLRLRNHHREKTERSDDYLMAFYENLFAWNWMKFEWTLLGLCLIQASRSTVDVSDKRFSISVSTKLRSSRLETQADNHHATTLWWIVVPWRVHVSHYCCGQRKRDAQHKTVN